jgi:endonuclease G, mitochondrial
MKQPRQHAMIRATIAAVLSFAASISYGNIVVGDTPLVGNPQVSIGIPTSHNSNVITISRKQYVANWDYERRTPEWVAWTLTKSQLGDVARTNTFRLDRDLDDALTAQNRESVSPNDYRGTCLDRGHQIPSGDRTGSIPDNEATFFMSNMLPQAAFLNRRTWVSLERFLRRQALNNDLRVQVYAGVVPNLNVGGIGPNNDIMVPLRNFKIAVLIPRIPLRPRINQLRYFVTDFPNVTSRNTDPVIDHVQACYDSQHTIHLDDTNLKAYWRPYLSTRASVEASSGIDFGFLNGAHAMTPDEVDLLIGTDGMAD